MGNQPRGQDAIKLMGESIERTVQYGIAVQVRLKARTALNDYELKKQLRKLKIDVGEPLDSDKSKMDEIYTNIR